MLILLRAGIIRTLAEGLDALRTTGKSWKSGLAVDGLRLVKSASSGAGRCVSVLHGLAYSSERPSAGSETPKDSWMISNPCIAVKQRGMN